jgi:hypothetical protein
MVTVKLDELKYFNIGILLMVEISQTPAPLDASEHAKIAL